MTSKLTAAHAEIITTLLRVLLDKIYTNRRGPLTLWSGDYCYTIQRHIQHKWHTYGKGA